jgi:Family of unknown function (DUF5681)
MNPNLTQVSKPTQWKAGVSGNPNGRPVGTRQAFSAAFYRDLAEVWAAHGTDAMLNTAKSYRGTRPVNSPLENPIKHEGFEADKHGRPWKVVAGQISANVFHCATIPDGSACKWEDGALERTEAKNRGALKGSFADAAEIGAAVFYADLDWQE